jgi:Transposase zinc-binding domain
MPPIAMLARGPVRHERHCPETTLLCQLVERYYPDFLAALAERDRYLPTYVHEEFEAYLKCGRLEHGFLRVRCTTCHAERLVAFSCKRRGFCPSCFVDAGLRLFLALLLSPIVRPAGRERKRPGNTFRDRPAAVLVGRMDSPIAQRAWVPPTKSPRIW